MVSRRLDLVIAAGLWISLVAVAQVQPADLESRILEAEALNVTGTREESETNLDVLMEEMDGATPDQRARVTILRARNEALAGEYAAALDLLEPLATAELDPAVRLDAVGTAANILLNQERFAEGYRYLRQGLDLLPETEEADPRVKLLSTASWFFGMAGEPERAIEYAEQALALAERTDDPRTLCVARGELSLAIEKAGRTGAALEAWRGTQEPCARAKDPVLAAVYRVALGESLVENGHADEGLEQIRGGLAGVREAGYEDGSQIASISLAEALTAVGEFRRAEEVAAPRLEWFEEREYWRELRDAHRVMVKVREALGDPAGALRHTRRAHEADRKLIETHGAARVAYLHTEFDTQAKEQQIALLRERNRVLELEKESSRQRIYLAVGGASAASVIVILLVLLLLRSRADRRYLLWLSQRDGLTGLRNHTSFFREANAARETARTAGQPFTLIVADIDLFKSINDRHGHIVGDSVLRQVGEVLRSVFDPIGIVGRIGGEEFAMALPGLRTERARELIAELNERLRPIRENGSSIPITMSYGVTEIGEDRSTEYMRRFADEALYEAKRRGRNTVVDAAEVCDEEIIRASMNRRADDPK